MEHWRILAVSSVLAWTLAACRDEVEASDGGARGASFAPNLERRLAEGGVRVVDGPTTVWHDDGWKLAEGELRSGAKHGEWRSFDRNGTLRWRGTYRAGELDGEERGWYADGRLEFEGRRKLGLREGAWRSWYENGQVEWLAEYREGLRDGECRHWSADGQPDASASGRYRRGKKVAGL